MGIDPAIIGPPIAAAALTFALAPLAARLARRVGAIDMPGARKVHTEPIPRLGGLAVVASMVIVWTVMALVVAPPLPRELGFGLGLGIVPLLIVSAIDDTWNVRTARKLLVHLVAASIAVACGVSLGSEVHLFGVAIYIGPFAAPLSIAWLVGVTNAFNLIDGLDGLSAGLALIASLSMAAVFALVGQPAMAVAALVMAGALAGFLPYNLHPARQFLGDTGATAAGFCLATFALKGGSTLSSGFAALVPVLIMGLPIADTLIAMVRRAVLQVETRRGGVLVADRNHIHHRLLALGLDHRNAVFVLYGAGLVLAAAGFGSMFLKVRQAALFLAALLVAAFVGVNRLDYEEFAFIRRGTVLRVYERPVVNRSLFVLSIDLLTCVLASYLALGLKLDLWGLQRVGPLVADLVLTFAPLTALIFWYAGIYRGAWRLATVADLAHACGAAIAVTIAGSVVHPVVSSVTHPASVFLIYGLISLVLVVASRGSYVVLLNSQRRATNRGLPALLYGAGRHGVAAASELFDDPANGLRPVGFIDDDPHQTGQRVCGLPVLGTLHDLERIAVELGARAMLLTIPDLPAEQVTRAASTCERMGMRLLRMRVLLDRLAEDEPAGVPLAVMPIAAALAAASESAPCGRCSSRNVRRSRAHGTYERFRKLHSPLRPYRCNDCGWRGWLQPLERATPLPETLVQRRSFDLAFEPVVPPSPEPLAGDAAVRW
jgi:UDP-GlcNAc:undecaprenyl-phosphate GlcNAc-1-phosphate transferase